jgi:murein DD-endopeptidase MepM/ murein hydrolase activator NlpD
MHPRTILAPLVTLLTASALVVTATGTAASADEVEPTPAGSAVWPLAPAPEVVGGFDPPESRWGAGHRGVDLAGSPGQPVRSALAGTVTFAGELAGRGVVTVDHGGTRTTYEPVEATVAVGEAVRAGDRIGRLQSGGSHCAPATCLHWGLLDGERYLDPLTLVGAGPVRLLPLDGARPWWADVVAGRAPAGSSRFPSWAAEPSPAFHPRGDGPLFREI